ncbi:MAG: LEA type 2 family protein [Pseudomonadota bacterium]
MRCALLSVLTLGILVSLASGCSSLNPQFEAPSVRVLGVRPLSSQGNQLVPRFEIDLLVVNPNASSLSMRGMSYRLFLNDLEVVEGVANNLPEVEGYGEANIVLPATLNVVDSVRFVSGMLRGEDTDVRWRLAARLDVSALLPAIRIEEEGVLELDAMRAP